MAKTDAAVVILAAGASSRMPEHKLLMPLAGKPLILHAIATAVEASVGEVVVILGRNAHLLRSLLQDWPCTCLENQDYLNGMGSSFRVAVDHLQNRASLIFMLADMPFVSVQTLSLLADLDAPLVSCRYGAVQAPPVKFQQQLYSELRELQEGAKPVFRKHHDQMKLLDRPESELLDLDTQEDYERANARFSDR